MCGTACNIVKTYVTSNDIIEGNGRLRFTKEGTFSKNVLFVSSCFCVSSLFIFWFISRRTCARLSRWPRTIL